MRKYLPSSAQLRAKVVQLEGDLVAHAAALAEERAVRGQEQTAHAAALAGERAAHEAAHTAAQAKISQLRALLSEHNIDHQ